MAEKVRHYDVLVVGAGPAGLAAARAAASHGVRVGLVDAQPRAGGQVWRHDVRFGASVAARRALAVLRGRSIDWLERTEIVSAQPDCLLADGPQGTRHLHYRQLVLATGARELMLPFPGWTLPGVTGAGGAQALAKQGWPLRGRSVLVAGSGPLLLAAAATLRRHGAQVLGIHEQAALGELRRFAAGLPRWPGKSIQAVALSLRLLGVPYRAGSVVVAAHGDDRLREVEVDGPAGRVRIACDQLAIGYGLVPDTELAQLLGCRLEYPGPHPQVAVDADLRTSLGNVFAAGEACGIGGRDCALVEGAMAGHVAAGEPGAAHALRPRRRHARAFAERLRRHFALAARVLDLANADTPVCRCEDVPLGALQGLADMREAKLLTRCGMGACQGRICGTVLRELGLSRPAADLAGHPRPPLFPARLAALATLSHPKPQGRT